MNGIPEDAGAFIFRFTLFNPGSDKLGWTLSRDVDKTSSALVIEEVAADGLIEAWNRQCYDPGMHGAEEAVRPGDMIVDVNGVAGAPLMAKQIQEQRYLKLTIARPLVNSDSEMRPQPVCIWPARDEMRTQASAYPYQVHQTQSQAWLLPQLQ